MSNLLLIHTTLDKAFVSIAQNDTVVAVERNNNPREHGSFLHCAIEKVCLRAGIKYSNLNVIGVTHGPGSYTGIRVGLSAAKGLGYSLNIPLILCSTLKGLAATAVDMLQGKDVIYTPLIHARQAEYYAGFYDKSVNNLRADSLIDVTKNTLDIGSERKQFIFGIGLEEYYRLSGNAPEYKVLDIEESSFARIVHEQFQEGILTDALSAVPLYLKDAYVKGNQQVNNSLF